MSILKNISYLFSTQLINLVSGIVASIFLTRLLGAEGRGSNAIFTNSLAFAVLFFGFSISSTIPYFINSGKAKAGELLSTILIFILFSSIAVFAALNLLEYFGKLSWAIPSEIQSWEYKLIFTGTYFCNLLSSVVSTYLSTFKKFKEVSIYTILFQILPASIYIFIYFRLPLFSESGFFKILVIITFILAVFSTIILILIFITILDIKPAQKLLPLSLVKQFILFSSMAYIGNVFQFFSYKLDFWLVDYYDGKSQLGIYSLATQLSQLLWMLPTAVASVLYTYASSSTEEEAVNYTIYLKKGALYSTSILAIAGTVLSYYFVPILYGREFVDVYKLMFIFMLGIIPFSIPIVVSSLLAARGRFKISFYTGISVSIVSVGLYSILIPRYGMIGGAVASSVSYFCSSIICEYWLHKIYKVNIATALLPDREFIFQVKKALKLK